MHIVVAANPSARFGRAAPYGGRVAARLRALGHDVRLIEATSWRAQLEQTRFAMLQGDLLVVAGGDGMVHLAANIVGGTSKPVLVVPAGSGNDFAEAIGIRSPEQAIDALEGMLAAEPERYDLIRVEHSGGVALAAGMISVGFDADVAARSDRLRRVPSRIRYETAIALTVLRPRHRTFRIRFDGGAEQVWRTLVAAVANNRTAGGGIPLVPSASMQDGRLTTVLAAPLAYPRFLRLLLKALRGTHEADARVTVVESETVELASDEPVVASADGEMLGALPLRCSVMPGALRVHGMP